MKTIFRLLIVAFLFVNVTEVRAEKVKMNDTKTRNLKGTTAGCSPSSTFAWLNINNARVRVNAGGDMWWDLPGGTGSKYYIPANGSATSLYAGSLWIAGLDVNKQLKCAAIRFRQVGNDFWTGPLTIDGTAAIDATTCMQYDKMYGITRDEVDDFLANCDEEGRPLPGYEIPTSITNWPAHGDPSKNMSYYLAPFYDRGKDGNYDPTDGDYPYYDIDNVLCHTKTPTMDEEYEGSMTGSILSDQVIKGDQTIWWVFNDKGNSHTETGGSAIGMEIRAQAFAFSTNDEINNMTFYSYEIINRSTYTLTNTYFSPWTDVDLGYAKDDYVGCDVARGLGYGYNGTNTDGNGETESYGANPPAVGVDFFQGPYLDPDGVDNPKFDANGVQLCDESINGVNFGNGIVDDERYGMRRFVYHNNTNNNITGDPDKAAEYYLLLRGIWKNGARMQYGGTAVPGAAGTAGPECDFMFPHDSDPCNWGTGGLPPANGWNTGGKYWSEETGNDGQPNPVEDRRFMQSAGPFTLRSGAVNYITFGVPWARANTGTAWASVELLRTVDDKCQSMFDNCFDVIDGPDAPDLTIRELDKKLIFYISNSEGSNNYKEGYEECDPNIQGPLPTDSTKRKDSIFRFEGYKVYQLANKEISVDELNDNNKARLVYQCDIKNNVGTIINFIYDETLGESVPTMMVQGGDNGINHTFVLNQDEFATGTDLNLVNHTTYYYMAISYGYNNYLEYEANEINPMGLYGQKEPYLAGRKNIRIYSATPHKIVNGTKLNSSYGDEPSITRFVGLGNGGNQLELTQQTIDEIMSKNPADSSVTFGHPDYPVAYHPTYMAGNGPISVKIVDPLNVVSTDYALWFDGFKQRYINGVTGNPAVKGDSAAKQVSRWYLKDLNDSTIYVSDSTTEYGEEKLFLERGISIQISQPWNIGPINVGITGNDNQSVYEILAPNNGVISSTVTYADSSNRWLSGIRDDDNYVGTALNWILSGTYADQDNVANNDFSVSSSTGGTTRPYDPTENFENIAEGTWAPYILTSPSSSQMPGPLFKTNCRTDSLWQKIGSIDIVLTSDKSKWTRCPVVEMCLDKKLSEGNADKFTLRKAPSVDKYGNPCDSMDMEPSDNPEDPNYIAANGMGWFPGYAIDIESGTRLNLIFGEDSFYPQLNGRDMLFNPPALKETTVLGQTEQISDPVLFDQIDYTPVFGGKHYVYIMSIVNGGIVPPNGPEANKIDYNIPAYDAGRYAHYTLSRIGNASSSVQTVHYIRFWSFMQWAGMPMAVEGRPWLQEGNPVKISVRVAKPYRSGYGDKVLDTVFEGLYDTINHNGYNPYYTFSTFGEGPTYNETTKSETDLDLITVVPNPYYAHSNYEGNSLVNKVKICNVPDKCVVTIYTTNGTKIRQFKKDDPTVTSIDWDLTNFSSTPIASGFYIIHVKDNVNGGEKIVKFYAAMRQVDLNTF